MYNSVVEKVLACGMMRKSLRSEKEELVTSFELSFAIHKEMDANKMRAEFHFDLNDGSLVFDKVLGRDSEDNFYNEENGNLDQRKCEIKKVIVGTVVNMYNEKIKK